MTVAVPAGPVAPDALMRPVRAARQPAGVRRAVERRALGEQVALALADVIAAGCALGLAILAFGHHDRLEPLAVLALPLVVVLGHLQGVYARDELTINKAVAARAPVLFQLATLYAMVIFVAHDGLVAGGFAAVQGIVVWLSVFAFMLVARAGVAGSVRRLTGPERCLFVGSAPTCERLATKLRSTGPHVVLAGRITTDELSPTDLAAVADLLHDLIEESRAHRVVIEPGEPCSAAGLDLIREAGAAGVRVSLLPRSLDAVGPVVEAEDLQGLTLLGVPRFGPRRSSALLKRAFDVAGALAGLVLTAPLLAVLAAIVRLESSGPSLYRQTRVGRGGRPFTMLKLRTMVDGADVLKPGLRPLNEAEGLFKIAADPRITRVGRWLRRLSLDELPQLINVLRGEMSLVGPRPLVLEDDRQITGLDRRRLHLSPGMTGHWQVLGGARVPLAEMTQLDYRYVAAWSLWSDVKILLRTVPYVLGRHGM